MARRRNHSGRKRRQRRPEGVVSRGELREAFREAWARCGHPKRNRRCWRRILKAAWADV